MAWSARNPDAQTTDRGYAVKVPDTKPESRLWNAYLQNQLGDKFFLWLEEVSQGFEMGGTTGQSVSKRTFFPHNFVQPQISVQGITANQQQYAELGEFIRETQLMAVGTPTWAQLAGTQRTIDLWVIGGGTKSTRSNQKGVHKPIHAEGYIQSFKRGASRFEYTKEFSFDFVVSRSLVGIYTEQPATVQKLLSFTENFRKGLGSGSLGQFVEDPDKNPPRDNSPQPTGPLADPSSGGGGGLP